MRYTALDWTFKTRLTPIIISLSQEYQCNVSQVTSHPGPSIYGNSVKSPSKWALWLRLQPPSMRAQWHWWLALEAPNHDPVAIILAHWIKKQCSTSSYYWVHLFKLYDWIISNIIWPPALRSTRVSPSLPQCWALCWMSLIGKCRRPSVSCKGRAWIWRAWIWRAWIRPRQEIHGQQVEYCLFLQCCDSVTVMW